MNKETPAGELTDAQIIQAWYAAGHDCWSLENTVVTAARAIIAADRELRQTAQPAPAVVGPMALQEVSVKHWAQRALEAQPKSDPEYWPLSYKAGHMEDELIELRAALKIAIAASPQPHQIAEPASKAAKDVLAERERQISVEGWTPKHDDEHDSGQLAGAAACYARHINARSWVVADLDEGLEVYRTEPAQDYWPWDESWWKPTTPRRDAVKACALLLAEIERIDRATTPKEPS